MLLMHECMGERITAGGRGMSCRVRLMYGLGILKVFGFGLERGTNGSGSVSKEAVPVGDLQCSGLGGEVSRVACVGRWKMMVI